MAANLVRKEGEKWGWFEVEIQAEEDSRGVPEVLELTGNSQIPAVPALSCFVCWCLSAGRGSCSP